MSYAEKFNDRLAVLTSWAPASRSRAAESEAVLQRNPDGTLSYAVDVGAVLKSAFFALLGACLIYAYVFSETAVGRILDSFFETSFVEIAIGSALCGLSLANIWRICRPEVFDKRAGWYWHGWRKPIRGRKPRIGKRAVRLELIHAIQLLAKEVTRDDETHVVYELNLVLDDGARLNLSCCGDWALLRKEAGMLASYLVVPVWDASDDLFRITM